MHRGVRYKLPVRLLILPEWGRRQLSTALRALFQSEGCNQTVSMSLIQPFTMSSSMLFRSF